MKILNSPLLAFITLCAFIALAAYSIGWRLCYLPHFDYLTQLDIIGNGL